MNQLHPALLEPLTEALRKAGDTTTIRSVLPVSGGCINQARRIETRQAVYFLKWNDSPLPGMFTTEASGLQLLAATNTVRVPAVLSVSEVSGEQPSFIFMEWLEGIKKGDEALLGEQLARLHRQSVSPHTPPDYGLDYHNYIGSTPQINTWEPDWSRFFATNRLRPQMVLARTNGHLPAHRQHRLEQLIERLPEFLGGYEQRPSLIHGDLWRGNVIDSPQGMALIDPAVSYSEREAELSYTELFGSFSARFYDAYQAVWPLDPGYAERRDLHNLYHLLNHLNLFGEHYGRAVDQVLGRFIG